MKRTALIALLAAMGAALAQAQGLYLDNGFGLEAGAFSSDRSPLYGAAAGYAFAGRFEAGVGYSVYLDRSDPSTDVKSVSPYLGYYAMRQRSGAPVTLRIGALVQIHRFSGSNFLAREANSETLGVQATVARRMSGGIPMMPTLNAGVYTTEVRWHGIDEREQSFEASLDLPFVGSMSGRALWAFGPSLAIDDEGTLAVGVQLGLYLSRR